MKPNKKRTKLTLSEVETQMEVLTKEEINTLKGGGDGSYHNPYTAEDFNLLLDYGLFIGGYVEGMGYVNALEPVTVIGSRKKNPEWGSEFSCHNPWENRYWEGSYNGQVYGPEQYAGGGGGGYSPSTPSSYDKFSITTIDYINVFGLGLSKIRIQSPIDAKTGFWDYKIEADLSIGMSTGKSKLVVELMSATQGDISFKSNPKAGSLAELFNSTGKITTFSISALLKYTRIYAYDHSGKLMWSSNAFGGGVATEGISTNESDIEFKATTMSQADSIIRAVFDNTIPGWQEYLEGRNISEDSIRKIKSNPELWRLINAMKSEK